MFTHTQLQKHNNLVIFPRVGAFEQLFGPGRGVGDLNKTFPKIHMPGGLPGGECCSFNSTGTLTAHISSNDQIERVFSASRNVGEKFIQAVFWLMYYE